MRRAGRAGWVLGAALATAGCGYLEDRFKTCQDVIVDVINDDQTLGPYHIVIEDESPNSSNLLESGFSRQVALCLDLGYRKQVRVFRPTNLTTSVANANCVASKSGYESITPRVRWTPIGIRCENW